MDRFPDHFPGLTSINLEMLDATTIMGPAFFNTDLSIAKNTPIRENLTAQFRFDAFNFFNYISPANPGNTCIDCAGAGIITGMAIGQSPRQLEFSVTFIF